MELFITWQTLEMRLGIIFVIIFIYYKITKSILIDAMLKKLFLSLYAN